MTESKWIVADMGKGSLAAFDWKFVLAILAEHRLRPLPGAKSWVAGWTVFRGAMIPVLGSRDWCSEKEGSILIVLEYAGRKIACPVMRADWWQGVCSKDLEDVKNAPELPATAIVTEGPWSGARCVDVPALYRALGIQ
ncbi:MAG: chemotaxis protein CheW [Acidobacteriota bacterium]